MDRESLLKYGMRLDELNRIKVIDDETDQHANQLREFCNSFLRVIKFNV